MYNISKMPLDSKYNNLCFPYTTVSKYCGKQHIDNHLKFLLCVHLDTEGEKSPNDLLSTHEGESKLIAETILWLHHGESKMVRGAISRKEMYSSFSGSKF